MRIGIDMTGGQSPGSRRRGIGRYTLSFIDAILGLGSGHEFLLYAHDVLPRGDLPDAEVRSIPEARYLAEGIDRLATENPDDLDVLLITSPFEFIHGYTAPPRPPGPLALASIVYDLIPFLFQEDYLKHHPFAPNYYRVLQRLRRYDALLAISEATRDDVIRILGYPPDRISNIRGASDPGEFVPASGPLSDAEREQLVALGIDSPFVFCVSGQDPRKNTGGLLRAFGRLPEYLKGSHRLVVSCILNQDDERKARSVASEAGIADRLVLTNEIKDETLKLLYRRCAVFAFPSLYEGFGLPLLEAMHSGAAVVAGRNSSQGEVVGEAGLLVDASDDAELAAGLSRVLLNPALARTLGERALKRAATFTWRDVADRATSAIEMLEPRRPVRRTRPRIAIVSSFPPTRSRCADRAARLVEALASGYRIDLYHVEGNIPELGLVRGGYSCFDRRLLARNSAIRDYRAVIYQVGDPAECDFAAESMKSRPGIVSLSEDLFFACPNLPTEAEVASSLQVLLEASEAVVVGSDSLINRVLALVPGAGEKARIISDEAPSRATSTGVEGAIAGNSLARLAKSYSEVMESTAGRRRPVPGRPKGLFSRSRTAGVPLPSPEVGR